MSQYEEIIQIIRSLYKDWRMKSNELWQYAEGLERTAVFFSNITNGTSDSSVKEVYNSLRIAQKELCEASKALLEAADTGHAFCEGNSKPSPKKVRR